MATPHWVRERRRAEKLARAPLPRPRWHGRAAIAAVLLVLGIGANLAGPMVREAASAPATQPRGAGDLRAGVWVFSTAEASLEALGGTWGVGVFDGPNADEGNLSFHFEAGAPRLALDRLIRIWFAVPSGATPVGTECAEVNVLGQTGTAQIGFAPDLVVGNAADFFHDTSGFSCVLPALGPVNSILIDPQFRLPVWPPARDWLGSWNITMSNQPPTPDRAYVAMPFDFTSDWSLWDPNGAGQAPWTVAPQSHITLRFGSSVARERALTAADTLWLLAGLAYGAVPAVLLSAAIGPRRRTRKPRRRGTNGKLGRPYVDRTGV